MPPSLFERDILSPIHIQQNHPVTPSHSDSVSFRFNHFSDKAHRCGRVMGFSGPHAGTPLISQALKNSKCPRPKQTHNISQLLYIAIPPCTYFLKLLSPLHCCTVCLFVLYCIVLYILCKHTESHFTKSNSLFVQTYLANKT